jgi:hypothetical protein
MHIENRREESEFGRVTREWWECRDCRTEFRAIAPQPSVPSGEAAEPDFAPDGTIPATLRPAVLPPLYAAPPQERVSEAMVELVRKAAQEHEPRLHEVADALALSVALITDEMVEAGEQALTAALPALKQDEPHPKVAHLDLCHRDDVLNRITETTDE